jgi:hypothetical protein
MFTTTKEEAFASPKWAYSDDAGWLTGDKGLSREEQLLCEAYEALGRTDLADCVRGGRIFHRLEAITACWRPSVLGQPAVLDLLNSLTEAFLGSDCIPLPKTLDQWMTEALAAHANDPDFPLIMAMHEEAKLWQVTRASYDNNPFKVSSGSELNDLTHIIDNQAILDL